jgi:hypothetical protein
MRKFKRFAALREKLKQLCGSKKFVFSVYLDNVRGRADEYALVAELLEYISCSSDFAQGGNARFKEEFWQHYGAFVNERMEGSYLRIRYFEAQHEKQRKEDAAVCRRFKPNVMVARRDHEYFIGRQRSRTTNVSVLAVLFGLMQSGWMNRISKVDFCKSAALFLGFNVKSSTLIDLMPELTKDKVVEVLKGMIEEIKSFPNVNNMT